MNPRRISRSNAQRGSAGPQVEITSRPPGASTRPHSRSAAVASGMKKTTNAERTTSNEPSSNGSDEASPTTTSASGTAARARSAIAGDSSTPTARAAARAAGARAAPVPQPTSSTRSLGRIAANSTSASPKGAKNGNSAAS